MTVAYNQRTLPLAKNSSNAIATSEVLAYDFTGEGALAEGVPFLYTGGTAPTLAKTGTIESATLNGIPGRQPSASSLYEYSSATDFGLQFGTGDFTIGVIFSTLSTLPTGTAYHRLLEIANSSLAQFLAIEATENSASGWYLVFTHAGLGSTVAPTYYGANKTVMAWVRRSGGVLSCWTQEVSSASVPARRTNDSAANTTDWNGTNAFRVRACFPGAIAATTASHSIRVWNAALSDAQIQAAGRDPWALEANSVAADTLTITSPAASATVATSVVVSGTYTGAMPTGVEVQFGANAYVALTAFTSGGGTWSGSAVLTAGGPSALRARDSANPGTVSADIASITVSSASIAFTVPGTPSTGAVDFRMFQRDGSGNASVRITGTYIGSPGTIQYSWNGGAYQTLVASPAGGVFDATVTLAGPGQGDLVVRHSSNTAVNATLVSVGVGDVYIVGGQSNHVGGGGSGAGYVPAVAPGAHPAWKAIKYSKAGVWRENVETAGEQFSSTAGAIYSVQATSATAFGSYFGALSTLIEEAGVPVAFVPCALGSSSIDSWAVPATITDTSTLYGAMLAVANTIGAHKAVVWWQGEFECSGASSQATHEAKLNALVDRWFTETGKPWFLTNLNPTGNGGNYATIHAAIAAVAASNTHVIGIADMGAAPLPFTADIHYRTTTEISAVAARAFSGMQTAGLYPSAPVTATSATITLTTDGATAAASLTGLRWAFFDQTNPGSFVAPTAKGTAESTDGSGVLVLNITGTALTAGQTGWLIVTDSDGTTTQSPAAKAFCGPVVVA